MRVIREEIRQAHAAADGELIDPAEPYDPMSSSDDVVRLNPNSASAYTSRAQAYKRLGNFDKALIDYNKALELDATSVDGLYPLAWLLATCPKQHIRDGQRAVKLATQACAQTDWQNAALLHILAAAYAEAGNFKDAIAYQEKAIMIAGDAAHEGYQKPLQLYRSGQPFRKPVK